MALTRITTSVVESDAVTTDKIAAGAVTIDKLAASANVSLVHADLTSNINSVQSNVNSVQDNVVRVAANLLSNTYTYANTEIGLLGNNAPETQTLSLGNPANVIIGTTKHSDGISFVRINSAAGQGKYNLDVSGNARIQDAFINTVAIANTNPPGSGFVLGSPANIILRTSTTQPITGRLHMGVPNSFAGGGTYAVDIRSNANIGDTSVTALGVNNVSPASGTISVGVPANVVIRYHAASGAGNVIIGDATATSEYNLDVRGSANTSTIIVNSLTASRALISGASKGVESSSVTSTELGYVSGVISAIQTQLDGKDTRANVDAFGSYANTNLDTKANVSATYFLALANDYATYELLNANINVVQDNVTALPDSASNDFITYTRLNANINVVQDNIASVISGSTAFTGAITMNDDLTVQGNLTVAGSFANLAVQDSYTDDRMIMLANSFTGSPSLDVGLLFNRGNQGNAAFFYDESERRFRLSDTQDPSSNTALSSVRDSNLQLGNLFVESITFNGTAISATGVELNYTDGVVSAIQAQLDGKDTRANVDAFGSYANTNLDTKANVSATYFLALANDFVTYTRLNANINVVQNNVTATETRVNANINVVQDNVASITSRSDAFGIYANTNLDTKANVSATYFLALANDYATYELLNANINVVQDNVASITSRSDAFGTYANTNLDTKANVSATYFLALGNDFVTYTRLNANINTTTDNVTAVETRINANIDIVQDNVDAIAGTTLSPASNTVTSLAGANAYGIGAAVTVLARTRVYVSGVSQLPTTDYVVPSSGVMQLTDPSADIPAGLPILIQYWD